MHEECGVFGISQNKNAAFNSILGLHALQHRGQESFGVVTNYNGKLYSYHFKGQVNSVLSKIDIIKKSLPGDCAIGHVRYSTSGSKFIAQPMLGNSIFGNFAIAHNGNLINISPIREQLIKQGCIFKSDIDTEVIVRLIETNIKDNFLESFTYSLKQIQGAYSFVIINQEMVIGVRDPKGIRPLVLGKLNNNSYVLASETCAFDIVNAEFIREIKIGELIVIDSNGHLTSVFPFKNHKSSFCIFEYIYFSRPDSIMENKSIYDIRKEIGKILAKESPPKKDVDMIVPIPDSGIPAAIGYAKYSGLSMEFGITRNHYIGRTFIQPTTEVRKVRIKLKFNANKYLLKDKKIVLIDDSIVRGNTLKNIIIMLRNAGVKEIHLKISSPPIKYSCFYGIDTPKRRDLIAANQSLEEIGKNIKVDSLTFISINGLYRALKNKKRNNIEPQYCDACFTGDYLI